ncbi:MAG: DUF192 domain-containing protein [Actinomycetota bacterium]
MREEALVAGRGLRLSTQVPETHRERARGLLGRDGLHPGEALLLEGARSVHTVGMRFQITVAFLDADLRVLELVRVPPGRVLLPRRGARHVLELPTDTVLREGDRLRPSQGTGRTAR